MTAIEEVLQQGLAAHRRGEIAEAKRLYRHALDLNPRSDMACSNLAIIAAQEGNLSEAERLFRRALAVRPNAPEGFNNLGTLLQQQGRTDEAIAAHRKAIALKPDYAAAHCNLGNALKRQGKLADALEAYRHAVALDPQHAESWNNMGVTLQQARKLEDALDAYSRAAKLRPDDLEAPYNCAVVLHELGRLNEAAAIYERILQASPRSAMVFLNLGGVYRDQGRLDAALAAYDAAVALDPAAAQGHYNRAVVLQQQERADAAVEAYRRALALEPGHVDALVNCGAVLQQQGRLTEATAAFSQAVKLAPERAEAHNNFGIALLAQGRFEEALGAFQQAVRLKPDFAHAFYNLGNVWRELGKPEGAIAAYEQAARSWPDDVEAFSQLVFARWRGCDWTNYAADQQKLLDLARAGARVPPFFLLATPAGAADQLACAREWTAPIARAAARVFFHSPSPGNARVRVGYLSGDFHQHATAYLTAELFERHDRAHFEVIAYSFGRDDDSPIRRRLECAFDRFVDIRDLPHDEAAEQINRDGVDILVDLKGHTLHARMPILAQRPAPIQVSYLGFPATTGADFIDYVLVDRAIVPSGQQPFFTERLVHLPATYQVNDSRREIGAAPARVQCGLPRHGVVFCCFNNPFKLNPAFFAVWMRLLKRIPGSVLWLLEANALMKRHLRRAAEGHSVDPDRLVFAPILPIAEHLARHRHADLFLDTLPCNAHTTASDALWAGIPLLTCMGETFAGRVAASLLAAVGMPELIAPSLDDYERIALDLARDPQRLTLLRAKLEQNRATAPLFDSAALTRHIEAAYATMYRRWRAGEAPAAFEVAP